MSSNPFDSDICHRPIHFFAMAFLRRVFWEVQGGKCGICRSKMKRSFTSAKLTFDHVWPKSRAGVQRDTEAMSLGNLLLAHEGCNKAKGDERPSAEQIALLYEINRKLGLMPHETALWDTPEQQAAE